MRVTRACICGSDLWPGEIVVLRTSPLRGADSGAAYVYARSAIVPRRLSPRLRAELERSALPIGRLLREHRVETIREVLEARRRACRARGRLARRRGAADAAAEDLPDRHGGRAALLITEKLPAVRAVAEGAAVGTASRRG